MPKVYDGDYTKMFDISGKKAVIVGGAGGFGEKIAEAYAANGADICISSRREDALKEAADKIKAKAADGVKVIYYVCDASNEQEVASFRDFVVSPEGLGGCDILVNAQGQNKKMFSWEIDTEMWNRILSANVSSMMLTCRYFGNWMKNNNLPEGEPKIPESEFAHGQKNPNNGYGKIINFSSVRDCRIVANGGMGNIAYNTSKGAVKMLTKSLATDLGPNIQVNAIGPTITYTPMMQGLLPPDETVRNNIAAALPAQRIGYEIDVCGPAIFLASAASDMVTATVIYPDGGLVATS